MQSRHSWPGPLCDERVARSRRALEMVRTDIASWLAERRADSRFARFTAHFTVLDRVFTGMVTAIGGELAAIDEAGASSGRVYERCRDADLRSGLVRRTHEWYAQKYDQRLDDAAAHVLRAADEVVRSCWSEAFGALDQHPPTGPLAFLDPRFDASATPRTSVPPDLRSPRDAVIGEFVRQLPVPVVALPAITAVEPWWIVLAAHETGHHVQHDLADDLVRHTAHTLGEVADAHGSADLAGCWMSWATEAFADAFAALTVGPAATWAVEELQHAGPGRMGARPSTGARYPPAAIRTALLGELGHAAGTPDAGPGADDVARWLDTLPAPVVDAGTRLALHAHLRVTPAIARALVELPVAGVPLRAVCGWAARDFTDGGPVDRWARALPSETPVITGRERTGAARHGIAGGVRAFHALATRAATGPAGAADVALRRLRTNLPALLGTCGPPGHLATRPTADLDELTDRLTRQLLEASHHEVPGP